MFNFSFGTLKVLYHLCEATNKYPWEFIFESRENVGFGMSVPRQEKRALTIHRLERFFIFNL